MSASLSLLNLCSIIEISVFLAEVNLIGRVEANCRVHLSERRRGLDGSKCEKEGGQFMNFDGTKLPW